MKRGLPWSVKGIELEAREAAKAAAGRAGQTLGAWLNSAIYAQSGAAPNAAPPASAAAERSEAGVDMGTLLRLVGALIRKIESAEGHMTEGLDGLAAGLRRMEEAVLAFDDRLTVLARRLEEIESRLEPARLQGPEAGAASGAEAPDEEALLRQIRADIDIGEERSDEGMIRALAEELARLEARRDGRGEEAEAEETSSPPPEPEDHDRLGEAAASVPEEAPEEAPETAGEPLAMEPSPLVLEPTPAERMVSGAEPEAAVPDAPAARPNRLGWILLLLLLLAVGGLGFAWQYGWIDRALEAFPALGMVVGGNRAPLAADAARPLEAPAQAGDAVRLALIDPAPAAQASDLGALRLAAERGAAEAQARLGYVFAEGLQNVDRSDRRAFLWTSRAANQGFAPAQYNLGALYLAGRGVKRDAREALLWLTSAADQGLVDAMRALARLYETGGPVEKDRFQAARWFAAAARMSGAAEGGP